MDQRQAPSAEEALKRRKLLLGVRMYVLREVTAGVQKDPAGYASRSHTVLGTGRPCQILFRQSPESAASLRRCRGWWGCSRCRKSSRRAAEGAGPREQRKPEAKSRATRGAMSAGGAVEPGPVEPTAAPSSAPAQPPATGPLFRPISAEDEEQQPTEIESLCMNCYRNVRPGLGRGRRGGRF